MSATRAGLWRVVVFTMLASVRADAGKQIEQKHDPAWNTTYLAGSWPVGVLTDLYGWRKTAAAVADEPKYAYPTGKHTQSCMVKKTQFFAKAVNGLATFPSWSQCKKKDKFDGHQVSTNYGRGRFIGHFSCDLSKVTTCAMDASYGRGNQFYKDFLHKGNTPRLTCIRGSESSFSWTKTSIYHQKTKQTFRGSDPDKVEKRCVDGSARKSEQDAAQAADATEKETLLKQAGRQRRTCSSLTTQAYAKAKLECMRILNK